MSGLAVVQVGDARLNVGAWRGKSDVAYIAPVADAPPLDTETVRRCCAILAKRGYGRAVTATLGPRDARQFTDAGFALLERLHLLSRDLLDLPEPPPVPLRRARRADRAAALVVDARAFEPFWRLDTAGLDDAIAATPSSRFRVAVLDDKVVGYAVSGRSRHEGFLQRLAVDPDHRGHGLGRALVLDGLRWMRRWGVNGAMVNTQEGNGAALDLYEQLGFRRQPSGLVVLEVPLR